MSTVTVACKYPPGLFLQLQEFEDVRVATMGGHMTERRSKRVGPVVQIYGPSAAERALLNAKLPPCIVVGGFALTPGVDEDFMRKWAEQNADSELLKNNLLLAYPEPDGDRAADAARERAGLRSGIEALNVDMVPRGTRIDGTIRRVFADERLKGFTGKQVTLETADKE